MAKRRTWLSRRGWRERKKGTRDMRDNRRTKKREDRGRETKERKGSEKNIHFEILDKIR